MRIATRRTLKVLQLILSVLASAVTIGTPLIWLVLGMSRLPQGYGLLSKPGPVLTLLYVAMWLAWIWVGYNVLQLVKRRSDAEPDQSGFEVLMYVVTLPFAVLWILAWGELLGWPQSGPNGDPDAGITLLIFGGGAILAGGSIVAYVVGAIDKFFNPRADATTASEM